MGGRPNVRSRADGDRFAELQRLTLTQPIRLRIHIALEFADADKEEAAHVLEEHGRG